MSTINFTRSISYILQLCISTFYTFVLGPSDLYLAFAFAFWDFAFQSIVVVFCAFVVVVVFCAFAVAFSALLLLCCYSVDHRTCVLDVCFCISSFWSCDLYFCGCVQSVSVLHLTASLCYFFKWWNMKEVFIHWTSCISDGICCDFVGHPSFLFLPLILNRIY